MNNSIRRANAKKAKYRKALEKTDIVDVESDMDGDISDDDVEQVERDMLGSVIGEKYLVVKYIGKGTFSRVWILYNLDDKSFYAGKIFPGKHIREYNNELIILRQYTSYDPDSKYNINLVTNFIDVFNGNDIKVIVTPLYGKSVYKIHREIREQGNHLSLNTCKHIIKSVCDSLVKLHELNVLHMDIKPDNILMSNLSINDYNYNNDINKIREIIDENDYNNLINNKITQKLIELRNKEMKKYKKRDIKKKVMTQGYKLLKDNYMEKYQESFGDNNNQDVNPDIEQNDNNKVPEIIDLSGLSYILTDYSNSIFSKEVKSDEYYQIRANRPAENILAITYNKRSESWSIGTMFWYLLTGDDIFEPDLDKYKIKVERDRQQLALMETYIGKVPQKIRMDCPRSFELYDDQGNLLKTNKVERVDIQKRLKELRPDLTNTEIYQACTFMVECWKYDYLKRLTATDLCQSAYFNPPKSNDNS